MASTSSLFRIVRSTDTSCPVPLRSPRLGQWASSGPPFSLLAPIRPPCGSRPRTQSPLPSPTRNSPKTSMNVSQHRLQQTSVLSSTSVVSAGPPSRIVSATPGTGRRPICLYASSHCVMMDGKRQVIYALPTGVSAVRQTGSAPETALRTATTFLPLDYDCAVLVSALRTVNTKFMPVLGHVREPLGTWWCLDLHAIWAVPRASARGALRDSGVQVQQQQHRGIWQGIGNI